MVKIFQEKRNERKTTPGLHQTVSLETDFFTYYKQYLM